MITERMADGFTKFHLNHSADPEQLPIPIRPVLHHFTGPDDGRPHDHPWSFRTYLVRGSYVEETFTLNHDGTVTLFDTILRSEGNAHNVNASTIHRIVALPDGECITFVLYGPDAGYDDAPDLPVRFYDIRS